MYNDLLTIGNFTLHTYGLMTAIGIIAAYFSIEYRAKKYGLRSEKILGLVIFCLIFGYAGSKLLYIITILPDIMKDPSILISSLGGGWVVYGGIIGGIIGALIYCRIRHLTAIKYFDIALPGVALAQGFGRLGCFFAGCCYGVVTDSPLSITFTHSHFGPNNVPLVPTQLYSSALDFLLFFGLAIYYKKAKKADGQITGFYLLFYSIGRFILEFFRGDVVRGSVGPLSTSQFIAIFMAAAGIVILVIASKKEAKNNLLKKLFVFDLDGTIINTVESIMTPVNRVIKEEGYEPRTREEFLVFIGDGYRNTVNRAFRAAGAEEGASEEAFERAKKYFNEDPSYHNEAYPGMKELIAKLKEEGVRMAVLTNKQHDQAGKVVENIYGEDVFEMVRGQEDGRPMKPDPACLKGLLDELNVERCDTFYMGDSDTDMELAKSAGVEHAAALWGYGTREELEGSGEVILAERPEEVLPFILKSH